MSKIMACLECNPIIAAIGDDKWEKALGSPAEVIFYVSANLLTISERVRQAHEAKKFIFVHIDLAEGIGRDRAGVRFLVKCGVDGILSTKGQLIHFAKEQGLFAVQRFFLVDSAGMRGLEETFHAAGPDLMEIMPGVVTKAIRACTRTGIPVIAGGLIETKTEVTEALSAGATAVSTGNSELWYL